MTRPRLILDDGTPACLPRWAQDEIVQRRLSEVDLREELGQLRIELAIAKGEPPRDAVLRLLSEVK